MNILVIRQAELNKSNWITSSIEIVNSLNELGNDAKLIGIGKKTDTKNKYILALPMLFNRAVFFRLLLLFYLPIYVIFKKTDAIIFDKNTVFVSLNLLVFRYFEGLKLLLDIR